MHKEQFYCYWIAFVYFFCHFLSSQKVTKEDWRFERTPAVAFVWTANRLNKVFVSLLRTRCSDAGSMHRALALPKRGAAVAVNAVRLEISAKRLARFAWNFCLAAERVGDRFGLIFLASFFLSRKRMKWGSGQSPGCRCQYDTYDFKRMIITRCRHSKFIIIKERRLHGKKW